MEYLGLSSHVQRRFEILDTSFSKSETSGRGTNLVHPQSPQPRHHGATGSCLSLRSGLNADRESPLVPAHGLVSRTPWGHGLRFMPSVRYGFQPQLLSLGSGLNADCKSPLVFAHGLVSRSPWGHGLLFKTSVRSGFHPHLGLGTVCPLEPV